MILRYDEGEEERLLGDRNADIGQKIATKTFLLALKIHRFH